MSNEIERKLREIFKNNLDVEGEIGLEDNLGTIGLNSVSFIKIIVAIEKEFDIEFEDESLNYNVFKNIKELIIYIENKLNREEPAEC